MLLDKVRISPKIESVLSAIPYAALGVLIFPGILSVDTENPIVGILGGGIALILSYFKLNITYVIGGAVLSVVFIKAFNMV
ncbi:AzlD domain-containing protein [Cellulosilyticum sp. I15G10I2]|uniref:AzlD domain-containing protein n=1 Tax=Cellulosilyticum sp. I15G10I2 TaxID=1892843 RepID=UPI000B04C581|nr:AzlD domain-containing protein [Cellulosilyticum sp. I15G10I2]